jgi:hypothetical protein
MCVVVSLKTGDMPQCEFEAVPSHTAQILERETVKLVTCSTMQRSLIDVGRDMCPDRREDCGPVSASSRKESATEMGLCIKPLSLSKLRHVRRGRLQHFRKATELTNLTVAKNSKAAGGRTVGGPLANLLDLLSEISIHNDF